MAGPTLSQNTRFRIKVTTVITVALSIATGAATAVSSLYRVRDDAVKTVMQRQGAVLKHYPDREEFLKALDEMNQRQNDRYNDLKDRINQVGTKVDGVVIYLRRRL